MVATDAAECLKFSMKAVNRWLIHVGDVVDNPTARRGGVAWMPVVRSVSYVRKLLALAAKSALAVAGTAAGGYILQLFDSDAGWTESLSASATVGATFVALWIASRSRSDRNEEQLNADRAQARLVLLDVEGPYSSNDVEPHHFIVCVDDNGAQPILDVALESAQYTDGSNTVQLQVPSGVTVPIVKPGLAPGTIPTSFPTRDAAPAEVREVLRDPEGNWSFPERHISANVVATVQFTDAGGNRWRRSTTGLVELMKRA